VASASSGERKSDNSDHGRLASRGGTIVRLRMSTVFSVTFTFIFLLIKLIINK